MATRKSFGNKQLLIREASDPATDPERLRELAEDEEVAEFVFRNPSVPEDTWRKGLLAGWPQPWNNPMAPLYLIAWTPRPEDGQTLEEAAVLATYWFFFYPNRYSSQGKVLLSAKVHEFWETTENAKNMIWVLSRWADAKGRDSLAHRNVVRILVECARTSTRLTKEDHQALDLLEGWVVGGEDRRKEALGLASSEAVQRTVEFAQDPYENGISVIRKVLLDVAFGKEGAERTEAIGKHERKLANLIRHEMPLPPVAE